MRIEGRSLNHLSELHLRLYSIDIKFVWQGIPPADFNGKSTFNHDDRAYIEFRDSQEIDQLIGILERFKRENADYIGRWD